MLEEEGLATASIENNKKVYSATSAWKKPDEASHAADRRRSLRLS